MAQLGRKGAVQFVIIGTKRNDPLPRRLRKHLTLKERKKVLLKIMKKAGEPMRKMMEEGSPVDTGALKNSFRVRKATSRKRFNEVSVYVGAVNGNRQQGGVTKKMVGWRAHWAELGTVRHAGANFIGPAIRKGIPEAQAIIREELGKLLRSMRTS